MDKLNEHLYYLKSKYSPELFDIVEILLTMAPDNRPNPK